MRVGGGGEEGGSEQQSETENELGEITRSATVHLESQNRTIGSLRSLGLRLGELPVAWSLLIETIITLGPNVGGDHCHGAGRSVSGGHGDLCVTTGRLHTCRESLIIDSWTGQTYTRQTI